MIPLRRHALVWLSQSPLPDLPDEASVVARWHADGNPFVVCRQRGTADQLSLGFCLPAPGVRPRRIAVRSRRSLIERTDRPPSLETVAATQGGAMAQLSKAAAESNLDIRVFGSRMWQSLTGGRHTTASSDLDVLIDVATEAEAGRAAEFLRHASEVCPFKLDGELSIPGLGGVHWREFLAGSPVVLVKSLDAVRMVRREELWM